MNDDVLRICQLVKQAGGEAILVGGCVRDQIMKLRPKDFDIEVHRITEATLLNMLGLSYQLLPTGNKFKTFKVLKPVAEVFESTSIEIAFPRTEKKVGDGHTDFEPTIDPMLGFDKAVQRRDFTMNSIGYNPLTGELFDPVGGVNDLASRIIRHVGDQFSEDRLRVLRAMKFAARYGFTVASETIELCRQLDLSELSRERIFGEWNDMIMTGSRPSAGLAFLRDCGWLKFFPELEPLIKCDQPALHHPEGDVWTHTGYALDAFAENIRPLMIERGFSNFQIQAVGFAVLCHDFGKPATRLSVNGKINFLKHEEVGAELAKTFMTRMINSPTLVNLVVKLVANHMAPFQLHSNDAGKPAFRRLSTRCEELNLLTMVLSCDRQGRYPMPLSDTQLEDASVIVEWFETKIKEFNLLEKKPAHIITGKHIMAAGIPEGKGVGAVRDACYMAQIDGEFETEEGGLEFMRNFIAKSQPM